MAYFASEISITANKHTVLKTLRKNLEDHKKIVEEARKGYLAAAREAIEEKLKLLEAGKIVSLLFELSMPVNHTRAYTSAIAALELHTEETIVLSGAEVRTLILNQWDWMSQFITSNSRYSGTARAVQQNDAEEDED